VYLDVGGFAGTTGLAAIRGGTEQLEVEGRSDRGRSGQRGREERSEIKILKGEREENGK
jgi:hypothetical protein